MGGITKKRWTTLSEFIKDAASKGYVKMPLSIKHTLRQHKEENPTASQERLKSVQGGRPIPPIPLRTKRNKWERTGVEGFPYAPQDESGVITLFSILCSKGLIPWQIIELNSGKGIDAMCFDEKEQRELRVEFKNILSRTDWNHPFGSIDYVICWENRWKDFPKPVMDLKTLIKNLPPSP